MKNITVSIDEETHRRARIKAAELGTSVSALVRDYLRSLTPDGSNGSVADEQQSETPLERRIRLMNAVIEDITAKGGGLRMSDNLTRDELYDEAINGPDAVR